MRIANRDRKQAGKPTIDGALGGTICPTCNKPFAIHLWSLRLVTVRYDRCPHCGKWSIVHRTHLDILHASLEALEAAENAPISSITTPENDIQRRLDESRFEE